MRVPGHDGVVELELAGGQVEAIRPSETLAHGLVLPAFADLHVHADRAFARGPRPPRSLADAVALVRDVKATLTEESARAGAARLLSRALRHGSLRVRTHVDVDEIVEHRGLRGVLAARAEFAGRLELEIVAFATAWNDPTTADGERRLAAAVELGADMLGGVPAFHADPQASVRKLLDLARALEVPADLHLDERSEPDGFLLELLSEATIERGLEGQVTASHCCALATVEPGAARRAIAKVAAAGITVIALPALNLYLQGRGDATPRVRGLTLTRELRAAGVPVRFASDNVDDVFYPYGDADPLETAFLAALAGHVDDEGALLEGICGGRARIEVGDPADLVLIGVQSLREALATRPPGRTVIRAGTIVSSAGGG